MLQLIPSQLNTNNERHLKNIIKIQNLNKDIMHISKNQSYVVFAIATLKDIIQVTTKAHKNTKKT
jgi:hypothetical protein